MAKTKQGKAKGRNKDLVKQRRLRRNTYRKDWWNQYLEDKTCYFCGESETCCLDHHHVNPTEKEQNIPKMLFRGYRFERVAQEISKCVIVCSNCHRKLHSGLLTLSEPFDHTPLQKPHDWI